MSEKNKKRKWAAVDLQRAVEAVRKKEIGTLKASKIFQVPRSTIRDYVKNQENGKFFVKNIGRKPVLPPHLETELESYCIEMEKNYFGLTRRDIKRMAFQIAIRNNLPHPFSSTKMSAGRKWLKLFIQRHPSLSIRTPQSLSRARILGFKKENVESFFKLLKIELEKIKFNPVRTFNVDETGVTCVQNKNIQIISLKGKRAVQKLSSAERGKTNTIVTCMSAAGQYIPPMIIFPRKRHHEKLMKGAPPGAISGFHPSGWIQSDLFLKWMVHFSEHVKATNEDPVLLILDGHYSHTRNLEVINFARQHDITIICLPPHSTHRMQPLDVAFMKPFKTFYGQEIESWLSSNNGQIITQNEVAELMGKAYVRAATMSNAISGFRVTGIFPFNDRIFSEEDFLIEANQCQPPEVTSSEDPTPTENLTLRSAHDNNDSNSVILAPTISPKDIRPVPTVSSQNARKRKGGECVVVTSSPYKKKLEEFYEAKSQKASTSGTQNPRKKTQMKKTQNAKKKNQPSSSEDSDADIPYIDTDDDMDPEDLEDDDTDVMCSFCNKRFSEDSGGEKWIQCTKCFSWNHEVCDAASGETRKYKCSFCLNN